MQIEEFRSTLTASDSTNMLNLCNNAMELLKANKIEDVVSKLYLYNDSTKEVKPVTLSAFKAQKDGMWGVIDENGKTICDFKYDNIKVNEYGEIIVEIIFTPKYNSAKS